MNNKSIFINLLFLILPLYAYGASSSTGKTVEVPSNEVPGLNVGGGLSDSIYTQTTAKKTSHSLSSVEMNSSLRVFFPAQFDLKNDHFKVSYSDNKSNLIGFMFGPQVGVTEFSRIRLNSFLNTGVAYAQGVYDVEAESSLMVKDEVELQWIPIQAGLELESPAFTDQNIKVGFFSSGGMDWYTQTGRLDGMNQSFWIPRYELGSSMTLFSSDANATSGFDGVRLSGVYYKSFASSQQNRGWAAGLGAKYAF